MRKMNEKAWAILDSDEKMAATLQLGYEKSSWAAGEIMNKSHYKYLEIKTRAEKYIRILTDHLELYDDIIPQWLRGVEEIKEYFKLAIEDRWVVSSIHERLDKVFGSSTKRSRNGMIIEQMEKWEKSGDSNELNIVHLIKEFDRWNNFRILPKEIQEPSAFKRRNKNLHKKHIKVATTISILTINQLEKKFKGPKNNRVYLPIATRSGYERVIPIRNTKEIVSYVSQFGLYTFTEIKLADEYLNLILEYLQTDNKTCQQGLEFWPKYRNIIRKSTNHDEVQKITPTRKYPLLAQEKNIN